MSFLDNFTVMVRHVAGDPGAGGLVRPGILTNAEAKLEKPTEFTASLGGGFDKWLARLRAAGRCGAVRDPGIAYLPTPDGDDAVLA